MPAEQTLREPLSGEEIKEIILQQIRRRMDGDSTLYDGLAYAGFTVKYEIRVSFLRSLTKPTLIWDDKHDGEGEVEKSGEIKGEYTADAPDEVRHEHDLPIPVLVQTPSGPKRQKVKIEQAPKKR